MATKTQNLKTPQAQAKRFVELKAKEKELEMLTKTIKSGLENGISGYQTGTILLALQDASRESYDMNQMLADGIITKDVLAKYTTVSRFNKLVQVKATTK